MPQYLTEMHYHSKLYNSVDFGNVASVNKEIQYWPWFCMKVHNSGRVGAMTLEVLSHKIQFVFIWHIYNITYFEDAPPVGLGFTDQTYIPRVRSSKLEIFHHMTHFKNTGNYPCYPWNGHGHITKLQIRGGIYIIFFLFLQKNICCGYSLEVPHWGTSNEYNNICFHWEIRKISAFFEWIKCLICCYAYNVPIKPYNWWKMRLYL